MARVLESPTLARLEMSLKPSTTWLPAEPPPLTPKLRTPPKPRLRYFLAVSWYGWLSRPGHLARARAFWAWRSARKRLDTDEELLGGEGVEAGAEVTQDLDAGADDEGETRTQTHNDGHALLVGDLGDGLEIRHVVLWVADTLDVDGLGLVVNGVGNVLDAVAINKFCVDAEARQEHLELVVGAAIEQRGRDDIITGLGEGADGDELGGLAGGGGQRGHAALERGDALLEDVDRGLAAGKRVSTGFFASLRLQSKVRGRERAHARS
ncbi:hypothetical protein ColKHC_10951 [Colletotrichum higginsianum]|nr:hypothetical protein ColKHC_10951 [Colletotrichum higginsianum]